MRRYYLWLFALMIGCSSDVSNDEKTIDEPSETGLSDTAEEDPGEEGDIG